MSHPGLFLAVDVDFFKAVNTKTAPSPVDSVAPFTTGGRSLVWLLHAAPGAVHRNFDDIAECAPAPTFWQYPPSRSLTGQLKYAI